MMLAIIVRGSIILMVVNVSMFPLTMMLSVFYNPFRCFERKEMMLLRNDDDEQMTKKCCEEDESVSD